MRWKGGDGVVGWDEADGDLGFGSGTLQQKAARARAEWKWGRLDARTTPPSLTGKTSRTFKISHPDGRGKPSNSCHTSLTFPPCAPKRVEIWRPQATQAMRLNLELGPQIEDAFRGSADLPLLPPPSPDCSVLHAKILPGLVSWYEVGI